MTEHERADFAQYVRQCTPRQVQGVLEKEKAAGRREYVAIVRQVARERGIELEG